MRHSQKTKDRLKELRKKCAESGGHQMQVVDKRTGQQRCRVCEYAVEGR